MTLLEDGRAYRLLESLEVFCPLGLRFWDTALDRPVSDGLRVSARPAQRNGRRVAAFRTGSGLYAFQNLPGMRPIERPGIADPIASPPPTRPFIVEVVDPRRRFLPAALVVDLPLPYRGIFLAGDPASGLPGFLLFSAPSRRRDPRLAVVRGELYDTVQDRPAAWARIDVEVPGGLTHTTVADQDGRFAALFPYPELETTLPPLSGSPGGDAPLFDRTWPLQVRIQADATPFDPLPGGSLPDLARVLLQSPAEIDLDLGGTTADVWLDELSFDGEVVLRTAGDSRLLIRPGGSSP
ncbi:MAG: hypothetical protein AAF604_16250 [Acidobacteriota bacterium]